MSMPSYEPMLDSSQYDEDAYPSKVEAVPSGTIEQQAQVIVAQLGLQLDSYPDEMIGILASTHGRARTVYDAIMDSPHAAVTVRHSPDEHPDFTAETRVCVTSIHSAKGLEFRAVHIVDADRLQRESINLSFTAITRAKTAVQIHYHRTLPGFVDSAIREIQPDRPLPTVASLFGNKGKL